MTDDREKAKDKPNYEVTRIVAKDLTDPFECESLVQHAIRLGVSELAARQATNRELVEEISRRLKR